MYIKLIILKMKKIYLFLMFYIFKIVYKYFKF